MSEKPKIIPDTKEGLHPRNPHRSRYNFKELIAANPELASYVSVNKHNIESIDFSDPSAVKSLNRALLNHFYGIKNWDIPKNYLCPPIPGRADYIHYMADLLASYNEEIIPKGSSVKVLDIGIGANCIYPIIGLKEYGWHFVGTDIDPVAITSAEKIISSNKDLTNAVECRLQKSPANIFRDIIKRDDLFDLTVCNPPFHSSQKEAREGTQRKWKNLSSEREKSSLLNFGGQNSELWTKGGEAAFVQKMIEQSTEMQKKCFLFSTLISKKDNLPGVYRALIKAGALEVRTIDMEQGQKVSRIVTWTFLNTAQQKEWRKRWKNN